MMKNISFRLMNRVFSGTAIDCVLRIFRHMPKFVRDLARTRTVNKITYVEMDFILFLVHIRVEELKGRE